MELALRFLDPPRQSFFLFGPRGTGKSTWPRATLPDALFIDLLQPALARELAARPERLLDLVHGAQAVATVVIDEVQRIPELLHVVHAILASKERRRFVPGGDHSALPRPPP
jgi:predicted AAA+ superfamily ATPase